MEMHRNLIRAAGIDPHIGDGMLDGEVVELARRSASQIVGAFSGAAA
jgi:hypothetical protein